MKEKLTDSVRFKAVLAAILLQLLTLLVRELGVDIDADALQEAANIITGLVVAYVLARTVRNGPKNASE